MRLLPFDPELLQRMPELADLSSQIPSAYLDEIRLAIDELPEEQRSTVEMVVYERLPKAQIAKRLGRSRSYVQHLWVTALDRLEEELEGVANDLYG